MTAEVSVGLAPCMQQRWQYTFQKDDGRMYPANGSKVYLAFLPLEDFECLVCAIQLDSLYALTTTSQSSGRDGITAFLRFVV